jgi:cytoskeletal protein CcmA (bactofilin family)
VSATDSLNTLVTGAIWRAEQLEEHQISSAPLAWAEVSALEEKLATILPVSVPEGRIARRGAVRAALKARDYIRADALAERYLAERGAPKTLRVALGELLKEDTRNLAGQTRYEPLLGPDHATIGASIVILGDLSGEEDLVIEGRVEGKVDLKQNNVTVAKTGKVKAGVSGRVVIVEGEVSGNVFAREQAILRQSGAINGNIQAPRVILEEGSRFKGSIDMETPKKLDGPNRDRELQPEPGRLDANRAQAARVKAGA